MKVDDQKRSVFFLELTGHGVNTFDLMHGSRGDLVPRGGVLTYLALTVLSILSLCLLLALK